MRFKALLLTLLSFVVISGCVDRTASTEPALDPRAESTPIPQGPPGLWKCLYPVSWPEDKLNILRTAAYGWNRALGFQYFYEGEDSSTKTTYMLYPDLGKQSFVSDAFDGIAMYYNDRSFVIVKTTVSNERLLEVCYHELGHILGLDHSETRGSIMSRDSSGANGPSKEDVARARKNLGVD